MSTNSWFAKMAQKAAKATGSSPPSDSMPTPLVWLAERAVISLERYLGQLITNTVSTLSRCSWPLSHPEHEKIARARLYN